MACLGKMPDAPDTLFVGGLAETWLSYKRVPWCDLRPGGDGFAGFPVP